MNTVVRLVDASASVEDAIKTQSVEQVAPGDIAERHFTLHTAEQIQQPAVPEQPTEAPKDGDWVVDTGEDSVKRPTEQRILW